MTTIYGNFILIKIAYRELLWNQFIGLSYKDKKKLKLYFQDLLRGKLRLRNQFRIWNRSFSFYVNRLVIKEVNAKQLIDWFDKNFNI